MHSGRRTVLYGEVGVGAILWVNLTSMFVHTALGLDPAFQRDVDEVRLVFRREIHRCPVFSAQMAPATLPSSAGPGSGSEFRPG